MAVLSFGRTKGAQEWKKTFFNVGGKLGLCGTQNARARPKGRGRVVSHGGGGKRKHVRNPTTRISIRVRYT